MDFRVKCAMQHLFSVLPGGRTLNYLMQRHVSRSLPVSDARVDAYRGIAERHWLHFRNATGREPERILELGSGQHLCVPILLGMKGARVTASDIERNARPELVADMLRRLGAKSLEAAGVSYEAPFQASRAPASSFDMVVSNSVLEHVPTAELPRLLDDCRRMLRPGGLCSFAIDYHDHWSTFDRQLSPHNFLRYADAQWRLLNPALQYQNRLRHPDYIEAFRAARFDTEVTEIYRREELRVPVHARFARFSREELSILGAWFVLKAC